MITLPHSTKLMLAAAVGFVSACTQSAPARAPGAIPDLAGRIAGKPQSCVSIHREQNMRVVNSRTLLYGSGKTIWLNHLRTECPGMNQMNILVTEPHGSQYCSGDTVRSLDPVSRIPGPVCVLGDFVPYSR